MPNHPYGRPADENSLARIQRAGHRRISRAQLLLEKTWSSSSAGDFDAAPRRRRFARPSARRPGGYGLSSGRRLAAIPAGARLLLVDKPDATQTYFYIGQPGIDRKNPDRVKLMLVNLLFGGRFTSMLNEELRVNSGLTYGAASIVQQPRAPGAILIASFTKTDTTEKAIDMALDVLKRLPREGNHGRPARLREGLPERYLPAAASGNVRPDRRRFLGDMEVYGLGKDDVDDLFSRIDAVSLDDANAVARKYYKADNLTFVLLGNAAKIRDASQEIRAQDDEVPVTKPGIATD